MFLLWGLRGAVQEVVGRETLQNKGFGALLRSGTSFTCVGPVVSPRCCTTFLRMIFGGLTNLIFSEVQIFDQIGFGRQKTAWGSRTEVVLKMTFFPLFPGGGQFVKFLARFRRAALSRFGFESGRCQKSACGCGADGFSEFSGALLSTPFLRIWKGIFWNFSLFFSCFALFCVFILNLGRRDPARVGQLALNLSFLFVFLFVCLQNAVVPPEKGLFLFISPCFLFFLLGFIHFSFSLSVSLSLSIYIFLVFFPSLFFCFILWPYLFFFVFFCLVSLLSFHDNNNIKILDVKGFFSSIISVFWGFPVLLSLQSLLLLSVFHYLSSVFGEHECFRVSKKTISKTQILVLHFVKHYRFYWGPFCRQNLDDV